MSENIGNVQYLRNFRALAETNGLIAAVRVDGIFLLKTEGIIYQLSSFMRKPAFCVCENKGADHARLLSLLRKYTSFSRLV